MDENFTFKKDSMQQELLLVKLTALKISSRQNSKLVQ